MSAEISGMLSDIVARLERIEAMLTRHKPASVGVSETLSSNEAMALLGYKNRKQFWESVRASRVPFVRINSRHIIFNRAAVEAWMDKRTRNAV